jgi:DNA-binding LacI/PurR family transcriptional regulator
LVGGDFMAAGTISALQKHGLRVPQDVSVMSIDGFNLAAIQDVPLTAVHVPRDELGTEAVHMLQQRLMRPDAPVGTLAAERHAGRAGIGTADTSGETTHRR